MCAIPVQKATSIQHCCTIFYFSVISKKIIYIITLWITHKLLHSRNIINELLLCFSPYAAKVESQVQNDVVKPFNFSSAEGPVIPSSC